MNTQIRMYGELQGTIWMPAAEYTKEFDIRLVRIPRNATTRAAHCFVERLVRFGGCLYERD